MALGNFQFSGIYPQVYWALTRLFQLTSAGGAAPVQWTGTGGTFQKQGP
jgi:hypothetical protein